MSTQATTQTTAVSPYVSSMPVRSYVLSQRDVKILLVEDHEIVRKGLCRLIDECSGWKVCGEAANGKEAIEKTLALSPDLVVIDISMPVMNGLEATKQIRQLSPAIKVVMISVYESLRTAAEKAGANAFVGKCQGWPDLHHVIAALVKKERT